MAADTGGTSVGFGFYSGVNTSAARENYNIFADGTAQSYFAGNVGIGIQEPANKLSVNGDASINSLTVGRGAGNVSTNTVLGNDALSSNFNSGSSNVAVGNEALKANTTGHQNIAAGSDAMRLNTTGDGNTAVGNFALEANQTGDSNIAVGYSALRFNTGNYNVAAGKEALEDLSLIHI